MRVPIVNIQDLSSRLESLSAAGTTGPIRTVIEPNSPPPIYNEAGVEIAKHFYGGYRTEAQVHADARLHVELRNAVPTLLALCRVASAAQALRVLGSTPAEVAALDEALSALPPPQAETETQGESR